MTALKLYLRQSLTSFLTCGALEKPGPKASTQRPRNSPAKMSPNGRARRPRTMIVTTLCRQDFISGPNSTAQERSLSRRLVLAAKPPGRALLMYHEPRVLQNCCRPCEVPRLLPSRPPPRQRLNRLRRLVQSWRRTRARVQSQPHCPERR